MYQVKKILSNKLYIKRIALSFIAFLIVVALFLTVRLFIFYHNEIKPIDEVKLYYDFGPNTVYTYDEVSATSDISEQFLSYGISYGIDVSEWQGTIDWEKVKNTGISFAIIRCGFRQTHGSEIHEDDRFRENMEGAINAGLKVGVYFFGAAKNEEEALEEAEFTINLIKDYNLTYPVVYDIESFNTGRLENIDYSTITDNILTFTETIGSYGYETMVYSYHNALSYMLDTGKLEGKLIWLAHYIEDTNYKGNYNMWQYTSTGRVDGIRGNVDLNVSYFTYVDSEDDIVDNPRYVKAPDVEFENVRESVKAVSSTTMRTGPTTDIPNKLGTIKRGTVMIRTGISEKFSQVTYNGRNVYVLNRDIRPV